MQRRLRKDSSRGCCSPFATNSLLASSSFPPGDAALRDHQPPEMEQPRSAITSTGLSTLRAPQTQRRRHEREHRSQDHEAEQRRSRACFCAARTAVGRVGSSICQPGCLGRLSSGPRPGLIRLINTTEQSASKMKIIMLRKRLSSVSGHSQSNRIPALLHPGFLLCHREDGFVAVQYHIIR